MRFDCVNVNSLSISLSISLYVETKNITKLTHEYDIESTGFQ